MTVWVGRIDPTLSAEEIGALAQEAYTYAYPMLVAYAFFQSQVGAPSGAPERQALNRFTHFRELGSPNLNNKIPWINTDTLYSASWIDLRAEPFVLTTPAFEAHRYQNIQSNDWYTMCFVTRSTRNVGNASRTIVFAGPDWGGEKPDFADELIIAETRIIKLFTRIIVEGPDDAPAIHKLQDRYQLRPLSVALKQEPPPPPAPLSLPPVAPELFTGPYFECPTPAFIRYFNALMTLAAIHPSEAAMFQRFARLGIAPGAGFDEAALLPLQHEAICAGVAAARARINERLANLGAPVNGWTYPLDLRGGRDVLAGDADAYLRRAVLAKYAIWGPEAEEVVYMNCDVDGEGAPLDGAHNYTLRFDSPPPAQGFWSFTIYDAKSRLLAAHPSGRYKRGDRDRDMVRGPDGSLTLYLQHDLPEGVCEANWLPVPQTRFQVVARLYWPRPEVLDHSYAPPPIVKVA